MKKISILIPCYKAHKHLPRMLASIMTQTILNDLEVVVCNDADVLDYQKVIKPFLAFMDIKEVVLPKNGGCGVARQAGIDATSTPYFMCIDADDVLSNPYAIEKMLIPLESNPNIAMVSTSFYEERDRKFDFLHHNEDMVWMFGKLYRRSFINKYNIRFNETRSNEDAGFNAKVKLVANDDEQICFMDEPAYYWCVNPNSITRVNNYEYTYHQSFEGYVLNMVDAIYHTRSVQPFNKDVDIFAIQTMAFLYVYFLETKSRDPRFIEQNFQWCQKYYTMVFEDIIKRIPQKHILDILNKSVINHLARAQDIAVDETVYQFIERLRVCSSCE